MKNILLRTFILLLLMSTATFSADAKEKSDNIKPAWIKNPPKPSNNTYIFRVVKVDNGSDLQTARISARAELTRELVKSYKMQIGDSLSIKSVREFNNGKRDNTGKTTLFYNVKTDEEEVTIRCERVAEYYESYTINGNKVFALYTLFALPAEGYNEISDNFTITSKYGARGLWRSAICPGWGQMHKGSIAKGVTLLVAEVAAVGGIIFTENERATYMSMMRSTPKFARKYKLKADNYETARNCCIGAAAAIYVYNLIDAIVANGAEYIKIRPKGMRISPMVSNEATGLSLSYNF